MVLDPDALEQAIERSFSKFSQLDRYLDRPRQLRGPGNVMFSMDNLTYRDYGEQVFLPILSLSLSLSVSLSPK